MIMLKERLEGFKLILASKSPRRQDLVKHLDFPYEIVLKDEVEEVYPEHLAARDVPDYLSKLKAQPYIEDVMVQPWIVVTADTIVLCENRILGKPKDRSEAVEMLQFLSGKSHEVITGVSLTSAHKQQTFSVSTKVFFKSLEMREIDYYVDQCKPFDKAGAYGIQEWIGMIGVEKIVGSYFNVVGLPVQALYTELLKF